MLLPEPVVVYDEKAVERVAQDQGGCKTMVSWEQLRPAVEQAIGLRKNEKLVGMRVSKDGLHCFLETRSEHADARSEPS